MQSTAWPTTMDSEHAGIRVSMLFFWAFFAGAIFLVLDPFNPGYPTPNGVLRLGRDHGPVKYLPLLIGTLGLGLGMIGLQLYQAARWRVFAAALTASWPVLLCAAMLLTGALYGRFVGGIEDGYLPAALVILAYPIGLWAALEVRDPARLLHAYFVALLLASFFMAAYIAWHWLNGGHAFHEDIFLLLPLAVYFALVAPRWAWLALGYAVLVGVLSRKNTSYLVLLATLGYLGWVWLGRALARRRGNAPVQWAIFYGAFLLLVVVSLAAAFLLTNREEYLPDGSAPVRLYVYERAWEMFRDSPVYGNFFTGSTNLDFSLFRIMGQKRVVTHSDALDVLRSGGVLGLSLLVAAIVTPLALGVQRVADRRLDAALHGLRAIVLGGVVVMLFNPLLLGVPLGTFFWLTLGLLVGAARGARAEEASCSRR